MIHLTSILLVLSVGVLNFMAKFCSRNKFRSKISTKLACDVKENFKEK